jgi:replicative DNA helicase
MIEEPVPSIPHNREAEEAVIGSALINPDIMTDLYFLKPKHFYVHRNGWIWEAIQGCLVKHVPVDVLTVSEELERTNKLEEIGGASYLIALINQSPNSLNAESYARIVVGYYDRRQLITAANRVASLAYDLEKDPSEIKSSASKALYDAIEENETQRGEKLAASISRVYDRVGENAEKRKRGEPLDLGIKTGFLDLDRILQGIENGELVLIAGRPGQGKSSLILNIAKHNAFEKKHIAIFSTESSNEEVATRFLAMETGIDSQRLKGGALEDSEWPIFTHAYEALSETNIFLEDVETFSPLELRLKCMQYKNRKGLDMIFVDYLQLMETGLSKNKENRNQEVSFISRQLKLMARELNIPVFAVSQLSRAVEQRSDKRPILSDLRESGSLEQDANTVIFVYRPEMYEANTNKKNIAEIIVAKRRDGALGTAELVYLKNITRFENLARQDSWEKRKDLV